VTLAILCSGQGRQHAGMFALTGEAPDAAPLFAHATDLTGGRDPREIVRNESSTALHHNRIGQILCTLQALAAMSALRSAMPDRLVIAGYSVGEVAAWGVAGVLAMTDTLDLVADRAAAMDSAAPAGDGLLFVRGTGCAKRMTPRSPSSSPTKASSSAAIARRSPHSRLKRRRWTPSGSSRCLSKSLPTRRARLEPRPCSARGFAMSR
jgi:malonyl CoA-acyl carrier protein transacylase